jgi:purine catabolism regulator
VLSVRELLRDLEAVELLAGEQGLDVPVRWVHISELLDPTPWLSGGELLLTTGLQLSSAGSQREFVERLADHQLAGVGFGTGFSHADVPGALREAAEERGLPLFEVPYAVPFIAITEKAFARLINEHYAVLQRSIAAHERLERIVLSEGGLDAVVGAVAALIGGPALVFGARGEPLAQRTFRLPVPSEAATALGEELRRRTSEGKRRGFMPDTSLAAGEGELGPRALALPVAATGTPDSSGAVPRAWLVGAKDAGGLSELDRLVLHQAVTIVALELLRQRVAEDTEQRLAGDVLSAVVRGELAGVELARRLTPFGLSGRVGALVLASPQIASWRPPEGEEALADALREQALPGLVASEGGLVCALVPGVADDELFPAAERLRAAVQARLGAPVEAGAGRGVEAGEARRAFHEARCALEARALAGRDGVALGNGDMSAAPANGHATVTPGSGNGASRADQVGVATYRDLGSFQLLLSLQDDDALRLFCDSILGPIEAGDGHYGGELMRSLEVFIECNGQWERAARALFCHRHTLRYRIRRVEELTGRSLSSARDRIEFWLALRGRELVGA